MVIVIIVLAATGALFWACLLAALFWAIVFREKVLTMYTTGRQYMELRARYSRK